MSIYIYKRDGTFQSTKTLTNRNLSEIAGMLSKVILKDGSSLEGYADPLRLQGKDEYDGTVHEYIYLWTFKDLNEVTKQYDIKNGLNITKVNICDIQNIHSILHSNPRWGGPLTNKFWIK